MNFKIPALLLLFLLLWGEAAPLPAEDSGDDAVGRHYPVNFSLYYPVSLNRSRHDRVNLNLSLIYGRVGYISGLDLSVFASGVEHDLRGVQICGLAAVAGETGEGWQASGLLNVAGESFSGVQTTGLLNVAGEDLSGFQISGLLNVAGSNGRWFQATGLGNVAGEIYSGAQLSGIFNVIGKRGDACQAAGVFNVIGETGRGFQAAGLFNVAGEDFEGVQAAGLFNVAGETFKGIQFGAINIAVQSRGIQIGIVNVSERARGFQLGLVNYAKADNTGAAFGPINIARNGSLRGVIWGGLGTAVNGGVRCRLGRCYSMASVGIGNLDDDVTASFTWGFHYGVLFPLRRSELGVDVGYRYRDNRPLFRHPEDKPDQHILETRLLWSLPLTESFSLLLGTGIGRRFDVGQNFDGGTTSPLLTVGLEFK